MNIIIYGSGKNAECFYEGLVESVRVLGVADGDKSKLGATFKKMHIKAFKDTPFTIADYIVICSDQYSVIKNELRIYGIDEKLLFFSYDRIPFSNKEEFVKSRLNLLINDQLRHFIIHRLDELNEKDRLIELFGKVFNKKTNNDEYPISVYDDTFSHEVEMAGLVLESVISLPQYELIMTNCFGYKNYVDSSFRTSFLIKYNFPCDCFPMLAFLRKHVYNVNTSFDVGANRGIVSCFLSTMSKKVYSFEPSKEIGNVAKKNIEINGFKNIVWNSVGVAEKEGKLKYYNYGLLESGHNSFIYQKNDPLVSAYDVEVVSIDHYCEINNISHVDILKIDVEGYEPSVIYGAERILTSGDVGIIVFEISPSVESERKGYEDMIHTLEKKGFVLFDLYLNKIKSDDLLDCKRHRDVIALKDFELIRKEL